MKMVWGAAILLVLYQSLSYADYECKKEGRFSMPEDCSYIYTCSGPGAPDGKFRCPPGSFYSNYYETCGPVEYARCNYTITPSDTPILPQSFYCPGKGLFAPWYDCTHVFACKEEGTGAFTGVYRCPPDTYFQSKLGVCRGPLGAAECMASTLPSWAETLPENLMDLE